MSHPHASVGLARRVALAQVGAGSVGGLVAWSLRDWQMAMAVLFGVLAIFLATLVMARFALGGGIQSGEAVMLRWVVGMVTKWGVIGLVLWLAIGPIGLAPLGVLVGVMVALVAAVIGALKKS